MAVTLTEATTGKEDQGVAQAMDRMAICKVCA